MFRIPVLTLPSNTNRYVTFPSNSNSGKGDGELWLVVVLSAWRYRGTQHARVVPPDKHPKTPDVSSLFLSTAAVGWRGGGGCCGGGEESPAAITGGSAAECRLDENCDGQFIVYWIRQRGPITGTGV